MDIGCVDKTKKVAGRAGVVEDLPMDEETAEEHRLMAFCGHCKHFEPWALGGGGDCRKGHDAEAQARAETCPDRLLFSRFSGPQFDMSE